MGGAEEGRTAPHGRLGTGPGAGGETHLRFNYVEIYATPQSSGARRLSGHSSETWSAFTVLCGPHPARPHTRGALRTRDKTREQNIPPAQPPNELINIPCEMSKGLHFEEKYFRHAVDCSEILFEGLILN